MHPPAGAKSSASAVGDAAKKALDQLMTNRSALDLVALAAKKLSLSQLNGQLNGRRSTADASDASAVTSPPPSIKTNNNINSSNNNKGQYGQLAQMGLQLLANNLDSAKASAAAAQFMLQNAAKSDAGSQMGRAALTALLSGAMVNFSLAKFYFNLDLRIVEFESLN